MSAINQVSGHVFPTWENNLDKEPIKPTETKRVIEKIEYKTHQKIKKEVEVRSFVIKRRVTKDYLERQAKLKPFGIGNTEDDLRQNVNLTSLQRENVWHPYYEVKMEEEDLKEKISRKQKEKKEADIVGGDIADIESKLKSLEDRERAEQQMLLDAANAAANPKRTFNLKSLQEKKREEERLESAVPQDDPFTVKLRGLTNDITEDSILAKMKQFGDVVKVRIPMEELKNGKKRSKGIAFVTFRKEDDATRAITEGEVNIECAILNIERALKSLPRPSDNPHKTSEFDILKRNK